MQRGTRLTLQVVQKGCVRFAQGAEKQLSCLPQAGQTSEPFARNPSTQPACASRPQPAAKPSPFFIYICARRAPPHPLNLLDPLNLLNPGRRSRPPYAIIQLHAVSPPGGADLESSRCFLYFRRYGTKPGEIKEALFLYRILPMRKEKNERFFCALVASISGGLCRCGVPDLRKASLVPQKSSGGAGDDVPGERLSLRPSF